MTRRSAALAVLSLVVVLSVIVTPGCKPKDGDVVATPWPAADSERVVTEPPTPPRWPLTGLDAPSFEATKVRVVSVKIENHKDARPQSGLDQADVVYETLTEGGISRFNALYQSQAAETVGPVRSARMSDMTIVPQFDALFAHCGGNTGVMNAIKASGIDDMDQFYTSVPYWRSSDRSAPHNLYGSIAKIREVAIDNRGYAATQDVKGFSFDYSYFEATPTVTYIKVPFSSYNLVEWDYDATTKLYMRKNGGKAHVDKVSGEQYSARNVVVLWAKQSYTGPEGHGQPTLEIELTGSGKCSIFRDGQRYDGTWTADKTGPPVFKAADGTELKLSPGVTWFQVVPTNIQISTQ